MKVTVLELRDSYQRPVHLNLRQPALDRLGELGVSSEAIAAFGQSIGEQRVSAGAGLISSELDWLLAEGGKHTASTPAELMDTSIVTQAGTRDLEQALAATAAELGVEVISRSRALLAPISGSSKMSLVRQSADDPNRLQPMGVPPLVVVADGANSSTRQQLGIDFRPETTATYFVGGHLAVGVGPLVRKMVYNTEDGFRQHLMVAGHVKRDESWCLIEVEPEHRDLQGAELLEYFARNASRVVGQQVTPETVTWGGQALSLVQNRKASETAPADNVVLLGDSARAGFAWSSGGANLALTYDIDNLLAYVDALEGGVEPGQARAQYAQRCDGISEAWLEPSRSEFGQSAT